MLEELHAKLNNNETDSDYSAVALTGLGGIGKTEVAARYVNLHRKDYDNVFWLQADSLAQTLIKLSSYLKIVCPDQSLDSLTEAISDKIKKSRCLFILDNALDFESIYAFLTNINLNFQPHIILTSQKDRLMELGVKIIKMDVFTVQEACEFFMKTLQVDESKVNELVKELQALPLAMQLAKSYMIKHKCDIVTYLGYFRLALSQGYQPLLNIDLTRTGEANYNKTLLTVWKLAFDKLHEHGNQVAIDILNMMAYMDGSCINVKTILFYDGITNGKWKEMELNEVLDILCEYSLISFQYDSPNSSKIVLIHGLVQRIKWVAYCGFRIKSVEC